MVYNKIVEYCSERGLSIMGFEKMCHIGNAVVREWKDKSKPNLASLEKIAAATGIPISEWLGDSTQALTQGGSNDETG